MVWIVGQWKDRLSPYVIISGALVSKKHVTRQTQSLKIDYLWRTPIRHCPASMTSTKRCLRRWVAQLEFWFKASGSDDGRKKFVFRKNCFQGQERCDRFLMGGNVRGHCPINKKRSGNPAGRKTSPTLVKMFRNVGYRALIRFQKMFSILFQTFSILTEKTLIPSLIFIFPKFYLWNTLEKNICKIVISGKERNLNKANGWIWNLHILSILYVHFGQIQCFFKVSKSDFTIQHFLNTFNTAWNLWLMLKMK